MPSEGSTWPRVWHHAGRRIIGLDSQAGQEGEWLPPLARGELGQRQLMLLEVELQTPAPTTILLHHHPLWHDPAHLLEDAVQLRKLLERRAWVDDVLFGHQHRAGVWEFGGVRYVAQGASTR